MTLRNRVFTAILGLALAGLAQAADAPATPREASQLVTGAIDVDARGAVVGFTLDHRGKLPPEVIAHLDQDVPRWRFEPVLDHDCRWRRTPT